MKIRTRRLLASACTLTLLLGGCGKPSEKPSENPSGNPEGESRGVSLTADLSAETLPISEDLFGIFLEDINFAVDAGLYAELVKNRSFEYGDLASNQNKHGWTTTGDAVTFEVADGSADGSCLNANNPHYAVLSNGSDTPEGIAGRGYLDGLAVTAGASYTANVFIKGTAHIVLALEKTDGTVLASASFDAVGDEWRKYGATLTPSEGADVDLTFTLRFTGGPIQVDMMSLMPNDTYKGLPIRKDLGEYLEALNPSFLRFPGGCVIEGRSLASMYNWKDSVGNGIPFTVNGEDSVGDPAARPQVEDIWLGNAQNPYYCTYGVGFFEYFQLCEALDCMPLPILNAGMTCAPQSGANYHVFLPDEFIQDALDLVEFCRGGADTEWGAVRISMGHPEPFALHYIGVGNEQWQPEYFEHYGEFVDAFEKAKSENPALYGDIEFIVANGPSSGDTAGWSYVGKDSDGITALVDEHYYEAPSWFLTNTHRYDGYPRDRAAKVFLGEYAAKSNNMSAALAEAAYMTALERNGDVVKLACYAPLFGNVLQNQWTPDMIFFNRNMAYGTPNYYVQQLFGNNAGNEYLPHTLDVGSLGNESGLSGAIGLGTWSTSATFDNLKVVKNSDGSVLYENSFDKELGSEWTQHQGSWSVKDGKLVQSHTGAPADPNTGDVIYVGDEAWTDYTLTVEATKTGGAEGFLIPVCVKGTQNNIFWNLGGWNNTVSCLQIVADNVKSGQISGTVKNTALKTNQTYELKVVVTDGNIKFYVVG